MWVRGPSPPESPEADNVKRLLKSCLISTPTAGQTRSEAIRAGAICDGQCAEEQEAIGGQLWQSEAQPVDGLDSTIQLTLVAAVPARKKTTRQAKKTAYGCVAWTRAVAAAATIPAGVSEFRRKARVTSRAVIGTATDAFIAGELLISRRPFV